jgi:tetratricopeptide (TPR) repeat protein
MGAAWADYDNDGWLDLIVTGYDQILLFRNDHGRFVRVPFASPKGFWTGVSWGDFNRDGYPDVYICGYVKYIAGKGDPARSTQQFGLEVPFTLNPASYEPQRNLLFRNDGHGRFTEVARELGVADESGRSLSALWHDFDGDGWPDLYVANDISENKLYLNRRGKFIDAGRQAWVEEYRGSMGLAAGDFDRDGDDDLFISHWIAQQFALYQNLLSEQRQTGGADSPLHFTDVAEMQGIGQPSMQSIGWGASFVDFDSDGWPDLAVANGSTFEDKTKSRRPLSPMPSLLFWNAHGQFFYDVAPWNRSFSTPHVSRGFAVADYDNDGSMDMAIVDHGEGVRLLRNDVPHGNWIELRLHSRPPGAGAPIGFADGATVIAWVGGVPLRRTVGSASYLSQDTRRVHIGLGAARTVDRVEVRWLNGKAETWSHLEANHIWDISEGAREPHLFAPGTRSADLPPVPGQSRVARFWEIQRAAMDAMKRQHDFAKASQLFREALAIDPAHEDAEYYLANCLAEQDDVPAAVAELDKLIALNPQSHRALQRKGELLAASARSRTQLQAARASIEAALRLNSEETGALLLLGEIELGLGDMAGAERTLAHVCQANQRAASAWFLRGYVAWKRRDLRRAAEMLTVSRAALGAESKPAGAVLEGDVKRRMLRESGFLNVFMQSWDGSAAPSRAYNGLDQYLQQFR